MAHHHIFHGAHTVKQQKSHLALQLLDSSTPPAQPLPAPSYNTIAPHCTLLSPLPAGQQDVPFSPEAQGNTTWEGHLVCLHYEATSMDTLLLLDQIGMQTALELSDFFTGNFCEMTNVMSIYSKLSTHWKAGMAP